MSTSRLPRSPIGSLVLFVAAALALSACGPQKKIEECRVLVKTINDGVEKIHKTIAAMPDGEPAQSVPKLRALAAEMDTVAAETKKLALTLPDLQKLAASYATLAASVASNARELADAALAVDVEKLDKLQGQMKATVKGEDPLVEQLNQFCQTP